MEDIFIDLGDSLQVSEDHIAITGDNDILTESDTMTGPPGPPGPPGVPGVPGVPGRDGQSATIRVGSTTTGNPGTNAVVVNSGTESEAVLDFTIPRGQQGVTGPQGEPGFSPNAFVTQNTGSVTITIEDETQTTTASVYDGTDGISPIAYVTQTPTGADITVEDSSGTTTASITNGTDGSDGFSPIATVTQNTGSATISITDENGTTTATVYDGTPGATDWDDITNKPNFATVATTGSYDDLTNKPTIPTVNDATLTIQKNGTTVQTFTANQSSNATANITVPTQTSELTNNSGFVTNTDYASNTTGGVVKITGAFGLGMSGSGEVQGTIVSQSDYSSMWNDAVVSKGTLENALSTKNYLVATNYAFTATTDGNGFAVVPNSVVKPSTGYIIGARCKNRLVFTFVCNDTASNGRYTIQCDGWNHAHLANTSVDLEILYVLIA